MGRRHLGVSFYGSWWRTDLLFCVNYVFYFCEIALAEYIATLRMDDSIWI